jgi:hypothetical protein
VWTIFTNFFPFLYNMPIFKYFGGTTALAINSWQW